MGIGNFFLVALTSCLQAVLVSWILFQFLEFGDPEEFSTGFKKKKGAKLIFYNIIMNLLGSVVCIYTNKTIGRAKSLLLTNVIMLIIVLATMCFFKDDDALLLILSVTMGMATSAAPVYLFEKSPSKLRGLVFFIYESSATLGIFLHHTCSLFFRKVILLVFYLFLFVFCFCFLVS